MTQKPIVVQVIASLLIFLFVYAAVSKLLELVTFRAILHHSPLITSNAGWVAIAVPAMELFVSGLLFMPRSRNVGLLGAFILMLLFTAYITYLLLFAEHLPCSCGGVLRSLGWKEHLLFNIFFTLLAWTGVVLHRKEINKTGPRRLLA